MKCIQSIIPLEEACEKWYKEFDKILHRCFKKIRITGTPPKSTTDYQLFQLMSDIKTIKEMVPIASQMCKPVLQVEIAELEKAVAEIQGEKCKKIIKEENLHETVQSIR